MSQLFSAYHAIGLYSQEVPFSILSRGKQHLLATAVDESFHLYSLQTLQLIYVGYAESLPAESDSIQRLLFHNGCLYVAQGVKIRVWKNGRIVCTQQTELPTRLLLGCGDKMLSVEEGGTVRVWECGDEDKWGEEYLRIEFDASIFKTTSIVHPTTYVNKVTCRYSAANNSYGDVIVGPVWEPPGISTAVEHQKEHSGVRVQRLGLSCPLSRAVPLD